MRDVADRGGPWREMQGSPNSNRATAAALRPQTARRQLLDDGHDIEVMLRSALRLPSRYGVTGQWMKGSYACYSTLGSSMKITSIPAPHSGSITVVSLNRPQARNALSKQLLGELSDVVEGLHREGGKGTTRALILASEVDNAFCAGADLKERVGMSKEE